MLGTAVSGSATEDARERARVAAERLLIAIAVGTWVDVADAAQEAYLDVGRLAVLARAETPPG